MRPLTSLLTLAALPLFGVALALASCGGGDSTPATNDQAAAKGSPVVHQAPAGTTLKLAFITNNSSEFWKIAAKGVDKANKELNINVEVKLPQDGKVEQQKKIIEDLVSQGYNGFAISPISAQDETRDLDKASETLNVLCQDSDAPESKRLAYIGTNNYQAGRMLGEELKKMMPEGGKIAAFVGTLSAMNAQQRLQGVKDAIAGSKVEVAMVKEDAKDMTKARTNVEDVINADPEIVCLIGLWSYNTPSIIAAVKASGKQDKLKIAGFDQEDDTLAGIKDGLVTCAVVQKPFDFGYRASVLLYKLATEGAAALPKDPIIDTGVEIINKDNVVDYSAKLAELKK